MVLVVVFLAMIVFSVGSLIAVRKTLLDQASGRARSDFEEQSVSAQQTLAASSASDREERQRVLSSLAASIHASSASNVAGVALVPLSSRSGLVPVSTDLALYDSVSPQMRASVRHNGSKISYQPVSASANSRVPGAVLGTMLSFPGSTRIEAFVVYSYASAARSVEVMGRTLTFVSIFVSLVVGIFVFAFMRSVTRPIVLLSQATQKIADGDLSVRVRQTRKDEIGVLQASFNAMAVAQKRHIHELREMTEAQERFVSDVSHELRTPVATIRMATDVISQGSATFPEPIRRSVELLSDQVERFSKLLQDLLEISRYDAGRAAMDLRDCDLRETVRAAEAAEEEIARARGVSIEEDFPSEPAIASVDELRITRIVRNLLANALDFSQGRPIRIVLAVSEDQAGIAVRDHGIGMTAEQTAHVFDRFWRADPSRSRLTGGSGLGLSIAQSDAQLHHGVLAVRSLPGKGTCFLLTIPRHQPTGSGVQDPDGSDRADEADLPQKPAPAFLGRCPLVFGGPDGLDPVAATPAEEGLADSPAAAARIEGKKE